MITENDSAWLRERAHSLLLEQHAELQRPSAIYRPVLRIDGDHWIALYGEDLATGVVGVGRSPAAAMEDFDKAWVREEPSADAGPKRALTQDERTRDAEAERRGYLDAEAVRVNALLTKGDDGRD